MISGIREGFPDAYKDRFEVGFRPRRRLTGPPGSWRKIGPTLEDGRHLFVDIKRGIPFALGVFQFF